MQVTRDRKRCLVEAVVDDEVSRMLVGLKLSARSFRCYTRAMTTKASAERIEELRANIDAIKQEVSSAAKGKGKEVGLPLQRPVTCSYEASSPDSSSSPSSNRPLTSSPLTKNADMSTLARTICKSCRTRRSRCVSSCAKGGADI